ncbi:MAG: VOC family protein [Anaerolineae bacterium]|nr:VOC family protein [Anaerolineae bacterium]
MNSFKVQPLRIDHIVILVDDLDAAAADYTGLGFTVTPGGEHAHGYSHNALIAFADDSYLELIAFKQPPPGDMTDVFVRFLAHGEGYTGLVDFALVPDDAAALVEGAQARGLHLTGPTPGGRVRPDGQAVRWLGGAPDALDLPFYCADVTPRGLRVPGGDARVHPNGVTGVARVTVAVKDLQRSIDRYGALLGVGAASAPPHVRAYDFPLGGATLTVAAPPNEAGPLYEHLAAHGEGPFALLLKTTGGERARTGMLDAAKTHGARIALAPAPARR